MAIGSAATLGDLVEEVVSNLYGFANAYDVMVGLTADISKDARVLPLDTAESVGRGVVEIGTELIWVDGVDRANRTASVSAFGRGFRATEAVAHPQASIVTIAPTWPKATVIREINNVIQGLYPNLFAVASLDFTLARGSYTAQLPAAAERILGVRGLDRNGQWQPIRDWDIRREASSSVLELLGPVWPGAKIRVLFAQSPKTLDSLDATFAETGLPESARDVVTLGAQARLLPYLDVARLPVASAEADEMNQSRPVGAALTLSQELKKTYQSRLLIEQGKLLERYPVQIRRTR